MLKKILIANRGEIAVRVINSCREMGITSVAVYSEADSTAFHVSQADECHLIGPPQASESYLNISKIIDLAKDIGADAVHPGYGFLSENAEFIEQVEAAGITFIGPSANSVRMMGSKTEARKLMIEHGVPVVPVTAASLKSVEEAAGTAAEIGYPVLLKATHGGGGKGSRLVHSADELEKALALAMSEARKAFGDDSIYIEKFIENPKHIEVQIIADKHGNYRHLFERECSIQRRHQKVIEEAPSASIDPETRSKITDTAIKAAQACGYNNAGTIEFLMDPEKNFYFLEMNTRLQVEHPVTELITGIDLVREQIMIAAGEELSFEQNDIRIHGHAIEARLYAEDASNNFAPSTGNIIIHRLPNNPGIRIDRGITIDSVVPVYYDPMLAKVAAWGADRNSARFRLIQALKNYTIIGVTTNNEFCRWVLEHPKFIDSAFTNKFVDENFHPEENCFGQSTQELELASLAGALIKLTDTKSKVSANVIGSGNKWLEIAHE